MYLEDELLTYLETSMLEDDVRQTSRLFSFGPRI